jgi:hypothetical protein
MRRGKRLCEGYETVLGGGGVGDSSVLGCGAGDSARGRQGSGLCCRRGRRLSWGSWQERDCAGSHGKRDCAGGLGRRLGSGGARGHAKARRHYWGEAGQETVMGRCRRLCWGRGRR